MNQRTREHKQLLRVLVESRNKAGINQRELSRSLKRPHSYISKIESEERSLDVVEFIEIARALRIDPKALFAAVLDAMGM